MTGSGHARIVCLESGLRRLGHDVQPVGAFKEFMGHAGAIVSGIPMDCSERVIPAATARSPRSSGQRTSIIEVRNRNRSLPLLFEETQ